MKPRIEVSDKGNPTIWESGSWQNSTKIGRGCLIAGPEGEKLQVIYDKNPQTANFQFLFFANPDQIVATAFVREVTNGRPTPTRAGQLAQYLGLESNSGQMKYDLTLSRIKALTSDIVQGASVLKAEFETLWTLKQIVPKATQVHQLIESSYRPDRVGYKDVYKELIEAAVEKALTPSNRQKLFWGTPRNTDR